jgi:outer membrane protein assembly factor BamB
MSCRLPGADRVGQKVEKPSGPPEGKWIPINTDVQPTLGGSWPRFRGAKFDNIVKSTPRLARKWPENGPRRLWEVELGEGHAGAAIYEGRVYLLDYDREAESDVMRCFSLDDGTELWQFRYPVLIKRNHGMSRTVPAVDERFVVGFGPKCHLFCLDRITGKPFWLKDTSQELGAAVPPWYNGQCPMLDDGRIILATGGKSLLMALDAKTGETVWKSDNPLGWTMTHVSIMPMDLFGKKTYVYCGKGGVAGVEAENGELIWSSRDWKIGIATVPSPVVLPENRIFFSGGYNSGALIMKIDKKADRLEPTTVSRIASKQFGSAQQTPILYDGHLFGVRERDKQLVCLDLDGNEIWKSGPKYRFGLGPYIVADGLIYLLADDGRLTVAEISTEKFLPLSTAKVLEGHDAWAPMAIADGRLLLRDLTRMVCLDIAEKVEKNETAGKTEEKTK